MLRRSIIRNAQSASNLLSHTRPGPLLQRSHQLPSKLPAITRARISARWYSDAAPANTSDESLGEGSPKQDEPTVQKTGQQQTAQNPLQQELDAKTKEVVDLKDKYLRQVAEYRNLQERTRREVQAAKDFAIQRFAKDLIESIDTFDLALGSVQVDKLTPSASEPISEAAKDLKSLHGGLKMTETVLMNTLKKHGLERYDPSENGDKFDPNMHEAMFQTPQPDKVDGTVFHTTQKGFLLNGRVLRAAKVGVVRNS